MQIRQRPIGGWTVLLLLVALSGCAQSDEPGRAVEGFRFAELPIGYSAVTHIANVLGLYEEEGVNYFEYPRPAGPDVVAALRSAPQVGAHAGGIAVTPVVYMVGAGLSPVILATTLQSNERVRLVTFTDNGITEEPATLRGKRIGRVRGTVGEIYLSRLLARGGMTESDIDAIDGRPADLLGFLLRGDLDAAVLWDPFVTQAGRLYENQMSLGEIPDRGEPHVLLDSSLYTLSFNIVTTYEKLRENRSQMEKFIRAVVRAGDFIEANRPEAQVMLEEWLELLPGDLDHLMATTSFRVHLDVPEMERWLQEELDWYRTTSADGLVVAGDIGRFVDPSLLQEVASTRVRLVDGAADSMGPQGD